MVRRFDLPDRVPLFPLAGALLLPRARLPLQIFEPRYLQMFDDALKTDHRLIAMVQPLDKGLAGVGCAGRITSFTETEDRRYMVSLTGVSRFRLTEVEEGFTPYRRGRADWSDFRRDTGPPETDHDFDRAPFLARLRRFMEGQDLSTDWDALNEAEDEVLINSLSMLLPFDATGKQALLEAQGLVDRRALLDGMIEFALLGGDAEERLQ